MGYIHSAKGHEISKAIFYETSLLKKQTKYQKDFCPMVILEAKAEILSSNILFAFWAMEFQVNLLLRFPNLYSRLLVAVWV
jgi:hypothetical protein